jgi:hypothetical protein
MSWATPFRPLSPSPSDPKSVHEIDPGTHRLPASHLIMAYYLVLASDGFLQSFRGMYDSLDKAMARVYDLETIDKLDCDIVEFDELNKDQEIDFVVN